MQLENSSMSFRRSTSSVSWLTLFAVIAVFCATAGCDTSFDIFSETDLTYSVYGILDASADTQFVRVEPVQDTALVGTGSIDARVTSENLATGETIVWNDSTFSVGLAETPVHNFWTTAAIDPESAHRFTVERARDGAQSTAEAAVPPAFPKPEVAGGAPGLPQDECGSPSAPTTIRVEGVKRLGAVRAAYEYRVEACEAPGSLRGQTVAYPLSEATRVGEASWRIEISWSEDIPVPPGFRVTEIDYFRVTVASVIEDWPEADSTRPGDPTQPLPPLGSPSNVESGVGFLGEAVTRSVEVPVFYPGQ